MIELKAKSILTSITISDRFSPIENWDRENVHVSHLHNLGIKTYS